MKYNDKRLLLSAQFLSSGNGGICTVARMTAACLSQHYAMVALACQDKANVTIGPVATRAFRNNRASFIVANALEELASTHVIYDFAGTARAHLNLPMLRRPYAVWVHGLEVWDHSPPKYQAAIARASLLIANSTYTIERAGKLIPSGPEIKICPLGTTEDEAPMMPLRDNCPPTVLLVGRVDEMFAKGHDILIDVWPQVISAVPNARLAFVGGGCALGRLRRMVNQSPASNSITVAGFVPDEEMESYWRSATAFAMLGDAEGFGLVYVDAMRHSLPIIASRDDAGQEVNIDGVTGFNVARRDKGCLVEVLVNLLRDRDYARKLGAAAFDLWKVRYTFSAFSKRLESATNTFLSS